MRRRVLAALVVLAIVTGALSLTPTRVAGQVGSSAGKPRAAASAWTPPRTPWGEPDLQGVWDYRTITPLERPSELTGKQVLTDEETANFEREENRRQNRDLIDPAKGGLQYPAGGVFVSDVLHFTAVAPTRRPPPSLRVEPCEAFSACDRTFVIQCDDDETGALVLATFGGLLVPATSSIADAITLCRIFRGSSGRGFRVLDSEGGAASFDDVDGLVFHLDKHLIIALQHQRPDLYFLHAAAVALDGRVAVLAAPAGTGKSTLTLALLENGFAYLSDELAPVDFRRMTVHPYAHALCLKSPPLQSYRLPSGTLDTGERFHVLPTALSAGTVKEPLPLAAIVFIRRSPAPPVICQSITAARAAARLMANALNPLAHLGDGLDVAMTLSQTVPCFELESGDLHRACAAVETILCQRAVLSAAGS